MPRFDILTPQTAVYNGHYKLDANVTGSIYNGYVARVLASGDVTTGNGTDPVGLFYDKMALVEFPTTEDLAAYLKGKNVNVVSGHFLALVSADLFNENAIPTPGTKIYDNGNGLLEYTNGTTAQVGVCVGQQTLMDETGQTSTAAVVEFNL